MNQPQKGMVKGAKLRARLATWHHKAIRQAVENKAQLLGMSVVLVNPAYTSQDCSACRSRGKRKGHEFKCPTCGHCEHADVNAAKNIRSKFVLRDGALSIAPQALTFTGQGQAPLLVGGVS